MPSSSPGSPPSKTAPKRALARARPWLGTYVEIRVEARAPEAALLAAVERAFAEIARVQALMSPQDPGSELARLSRAPVGEWLAVHPDTARVLAFAERLRALSDGVFDPAWRAEASGTAPAAGSAFAVSGLRARRLADARIDLGGVAKGYAVDRAVAALEAALPWGARGTVSAGGDARAFGDASVTLNLVAGSPERPFVRAVALRGGRSVATSSSGRPGGSRYLDARAGREFMRPRSASVLASTCMAADALTKVALLCQPERDAEVLERCLREYSAEALLTEDETGESRVIP